MVVLVIKRNQSAKVVNCDLHIAAMTCLSESLNAGQRLRFITSTSNCTVRTLQLRHHRWIPRVKTPRQSQFRYIQR